MASSGLSQRYKTNPQNNDTTPLQQEEPDSHLTSVRKSSSTSSSYPSDPSDSTTNPPVSDKAKRWTPLDRRQSWDEQEMRHRMQERLLGTESGKEPGFTEMEAQGGRREMRG